MKQFNVGILTFHHAHNYGAYLQACALCNRLNQESDFHCEIINYRMEREQSFYDPRSKSALKRIVRFKKYSFMAKQYEVFENAVNTRDMPLSSESLASDSQDAFRAFIKGKYDIIIVGSDEVWKIDSLRGFPNPYWLHDDIDSVKVSYAASCRKSITELSSDQIWFIREALSSYDLISVRDCYTKELVDSVLGCQCAMECCDPSFLYDFEVPKRAVTEILKGKCSLDESKRTMVVMVSDKQLAFKLLRSFRREYNVISVFEFHFGYVNVADLTPMEWLQLIRNSDAVITTYFHGTCFSLIYNTPFVTFGSAKSSKIEGLFADAEDEIQRHYIPNTGVFIKQDNFKEQVTRLLHRINGINAYLEGQRATFVPFLDELRALSRRRR